MPYISWQNWAISKWFKYFGTFCAVIDSYLLMANDIPLWPGIDRGVSFYALVKDIYLHPRSARRGVCWSLKEFLYSLHSTLHRKWAEKEIFLDTLDCLFLDVDRRVQIGSRSVAPKSCMDETQSLLTVFIGYCIIPWFIETIINCQSIDFTPLL